MLDFTLTEQQRNIRELGHALARGASLLIHDGQYTDVEYPAHRGWGHSSVPDALAFGRRCGVQRLLLFHHDPWHDDAFLRSLEREASERWTQLGGAGPVALGREGDAFDLAAMDISPHGCSELVA
jgi:ribonuclease BN (tRNA processing enzyme)